MDPIVPANAPVVGEPFIDAEIVDGGEEAEIPVPNIAKSNTSHSSSANSQRRQDASIAAAAARRVAFEEDQIKIKEQEEADLELADTKSELNYTPSHDKLTNFALTNKDLTLDEARKLQASLRENSLALEQMVEKLLDKAKSSSPSPFVYAEPFSPFRPLARIVNSRLKIVPPKPYTGSYDINVNKAWINIVTGYCAAIALGLTDRIHSSETPLEFHVARMLMSPENVPGTKHSPLQWFEGEHIAQPFDSISDLLSRVLANWHDDHADETSLLAFRSCRQNSLPAREFGNTVQILAHACTNREFSMEDLKETFVTGLAPTYVNYVKLAIIKAGRKGAILSFKELVSIATDLDGIQVKPSKLTSSTHSGGKDKGTSANASHDTGSPSPSVWITQATNWQEKYPMAQKSTWL